MSVKVITEMESTCVEPVVIETKSFCPKPGGDTMIIAQLFPRISFPNTWLDRINASFFTRDKVKML